jgi:hypothetical protein
MPVTATMVFFPMDEKIHRWAGHGPDRVEEADDLIMGWVRLITTTPAAVKSMQTSCKWNGLITHFKKSIERQPAVDEAPE